MTAHHDVATRNQLAHGTPGIVASLVAALGLSGALAVAAFVDQLGAQTLMDHVTSVYASHGKEPGAGVIYGLLYTVAVVGLCLWLGALATTRRGRGAFLLSVTATVVTAALAVALLASTEYGEQVYPPFWGLVALLAPLAGAVACAQLVRRARNHS